MKYAINAHEAPDAIGPYSQGTTAGRLVFTSGQVAVDSVEPHRLIEGDAAVQASRIIDIIETILAEVGCTLSDVAQTTLYLTDCNDLEAVNQVYAERFVSPAPARSVVVVSQLPLGARVEMDCVACR